MLNQPATLAHQLPGRYFLAALLVLALSFSSAQAQVVPQPVAAPKPMSKNIAYYIDGKAATQEEANKIDPESIFSMNVLKDAAERAKLGQAAADGVLLITTKANANSPAVMAFNRRFPVRPATAGQNAALAAATAYVTSHYPNAKLQTVVIVAGSPERYKATFTEAGQRVQLLFDATGQPVKQ